MFVGHNKMFNECSVLPEEAYILDCWIFLLQQVKVFPCGQQLAL